MTQSTLVLDDAVDGGDGNDTILGDMGADTLIGGDGNDILTGAAGRDVVLGGDGNDGVNGNGSFDTLAGGEGTDNIIIYLLSTASLTCVSCLAYLKVECYDQMTSCTVISFHGFSKQLKLRLCLPVKLDCVGGSTIMKLLIN